MTTWVQRTALLIGSILVIVGSFMTWISVDLGFQSFSSSGTDNIEGKLTAGAGVVLVLVALALASGVPGARSASALGVAAAVFGSVVLMLEYLDVRERIAEAEGTIATATVGLGVWVTAIGAALSLVAAAWHMTGQLRSAT